MLRWGSSLFDLGTISATSDKKVKILNKILRDFIQKEKKVLPGQWGESLLVSPQHEYVKIG